MLNFKKNPKGRDFSDKWREIVRGNNNREEDSVFVECGNKPATQRQFNLFHYFEFIKKVSSENNFRDILEVGCGRGTIALYLNKYLDSDVTLVDSSQEAIELAVLNFNKFGGKGVFSKSDAQDLQFPDNSFDMTVSIGLAEHFRDYTKVFSEQYRVLRPGGIMISLNIPRKKSIQIINDLFQSLLKFSNQKLKQDYFRNDDTPEDYAACARQVGFGEVATFYVNPFPLLTPLSRNKEPIVTTIYRVIYKARGLFMDYPFKGSKFFSQGHFLIARKNL